jgi:acetyl esterase/lipase
VRSIAVFLVLALGACGSDGARDDSPVMTTAQALALPRPGADHRVAYGPDPLQFGDLRLPEGAGPHPVAVVLHGGCWLAEYDLGYTAAFAEALAGRGLAVWSPEYRRIGDDGGGWPGTFTDVAAGIDHLRELAANHSLDLDRVVLVGHSAGGHLALWAAARHGLDPSDPIRGADPLPIRGVVSLAGIADLEAYVSEEGCGASIPDLIGGHPSVAPERLLRTSPVAMLPLGVPQIMVSGTRDTIVPPDNAADYARTAQAHGDRVEVVIVDGAGHFELTTPSSAAWRDVVVAIEALRD